MHSIIQCRSRGRECVQTGRYVCCTCDAVAKSFSAALSTCIVLCNPCQTSAFLSLSLLPLCSLISYEGDIGMIYNQFLAIIINYWCWSCDFPLWLFFLLNLSHRKLNLRFKWTIVLLHRIATSLLQKFVFPKCDSGIWQFPRSYLDLEFNFESRFNEG